MHFSTDAARKRAHIGIFWPEFLFWPALSRSLGNRECIPNGQFAQLQRWYRAAGIDRRDLGRRIRHIQQNSLLVEINASLT